MAYDLVLFKQSPGGEPVTVNPHLVRCVTRVDDAKARIVFDKDHALVVEGSVVVVSENLRKSVS